MRPSLPLKIYDAFFRDTVRLYRVMPSFFRWRFWLIFILQIIMALSEVGMILTITFFALSMGSPEATKGNIVIRKLFAIFPALEQACADPRFYVAFTCFLVVLAVIFKNVMTALATLQTAYFAENLSAYIARETLRRYLNKDYFWHISPASSNIFQKLSYRNALSNLLVTLLQLYSNVICAVMLFTSLFIVEPKLTIIVMIVFGIVGVGAYIGVRRRMDATGQQITVTGMKESTAMMAAIRGIREVIIYRQQDIFLKQIFDSMNAGIRPRSLQLLTSLIPSYILEIAGFFTIFGVLCVFVIQEASMPQIITAASMLMLTAWRVLPSVSRSLSCSVNIRGLRPQASVCLELLETFIAETMIPQPIPDPSFRFEKNINLKNITFRYPTAPHDSLSAVTLNIPKGTSIGIIGVSGAGKSTLAGVLSGLFPPREGEFSIDNMPLTPSRLTAYRQKVGFVPQTPFLMAGTIADNIAFSQWGQKYDRGQVKTACRRAAIDFVFTHPQGIDIPIGEGGGGISGGQAQRVSIARALFTEPDIIIFDEATSALDQASENIIRDTIGRLQGQVTTIIIAHRLTTVEECDTILWMENGHIREMGPADIILKKYKKLIEEISTQNQR